MHKQHSRQLKKGRATYYEELGTTLGTRLFCDGGFDEEGSVGNNNLPHHHCALWIVGTKTTEPAEPYRLSTALQLITVRS